MSNTGCYNTEVHDMFVFSLSHFLHNRFLEPCCSAEQQTVVYLFSPVKQSVDTNSPSHSHALHLHQIPESLHWNSSLPSTDSHFFTLFFVCMCGVYVCTMSLWAHLPHTGLCLAVTTMSAPTENWTR